MSKKSITHIVFNTGKQTETSQFWENVFEVSNRSNQKDFLSYDINGFIVNEIKLKIGVGHLGVELASTKDVDNEFKRLSGILNKTINEPEGGPGKGPYRFYIEDPNGITIEFESWEGCSD